MRGERNRTISISLCLLCCIAFSLSLFAPFVLRAQIDARFERDLSLELSPAYPAPGETVRVTARSTLLDLSGATLEWRAGGTKVGGGAGVTTVDITAGVLGSETLITVFVFEGGIEIFTQTARIHPTELDLLWESDSYVPPFYRGRALPSAGTRLRLEATPRFKRTDGSMIPASDIAFTWRRNGYVIASASGRGKSSAVLESPSLFGSDTITVEARAGDGQFENAASVRVPSIEPRLTLYEDHPLFGVMYHDALPAQSLHSEVEMSFFAVPYFAEANSPRDHNLLYEWRVNGNPIGNDSESPNVITINAEGSTGRALIELALSHATNLFFGAAGSWSVTLLSQDLGNPFTNPSPSL